tara:strand:+ start:6467 stop:6652 length:186 start_codon:yes stop_codon:yes gene_type:complete
MAKITVEPASWLKIFALVGKLVRYAQGGFTADEKSELISDLLDVLGVLATDIGEDLRNEEH